MTEGYDVPNPELVARQRMFAKNIAEALTQYLGISIEQHDVLVAMERTLLKLEYDEQCLAIEAMASLYYEPAPDEVVDLERYRISKGKE